MAEIYRSAFTGADLIQSATVNALQGQYVRLGQYKVVAGEIIKTGYAGQSGQENAQGRIFLKLVDSAGAIVSGTVRMSIYSPQDRPLEILYEWRTETLNTSETDRTKQIPFPEHMAGASEDKKFVLEFLADTTKTIDKSKSKIVMDITRSAI